MTAQNIASLFFTYKCPNQGVKETLFLGKLHLMLV